MAKRKRNRNADDTEATFSARPRRKRKFLRRLMLLLLLLAGLLAAAPTIVGKTVLRNTLLARALPNGWKIESQQAAFGWSSSQTLTNVTISDPTGKPLLMVESLKVAKPLLSLAMNQDDLGTIEVVRPTAYLETRPDGSNWEDFMTGLQHQLNGQQPQPKDANDRDSTELALDVVEGIVQGVDLATGGRWALEGANVTANLGSGMQVNGSAQLVTAQPAQRGQVKFRWQPQQDGEQRLELLAERLPLGPLETWLTRALPGTQLTGSVSADAQLSWKFDPQGALVLQTAGRLEANQIDLAAAALRGDRLRFQRLTAPWKLSLANDQLSIEQLAVDADWAKLHATGSLTLAELQTLNLENLPTGATKINGTVDLAQLSAMLPRTLQLREGVRIDAGTLAFDVNAKPNGQRVAWTATTSLQGVAGSDGQQQIRWDQPIEATVVLQDSAAGVQMEALTLNSPFATAQVKTQQSAINGEFALNLEQLSRELSQFVDMQNWQLRGLGEGTFTVARQSNQQFAAQANIALTDLHVTDGARQVWVEPKLQVDLQATGTEQDFAPRAIATGKIHVRGPRDQLQLDLLEPVDLGVSQKSWQLQVDGNGPLALWAARLRPWVATMPERLEGDAHVQARVQLAADRIAVMESKGSIVKLRVQSDTMAVDEPRVEFAGDALWDMTTKSLMTRELQLLGSSFSFRARDIEVALAAAGAPTARGNVAFRADLERLASMAGLVGQQAATWPRGAAVGQLQLNSSADQMQADFGVKVEQLQLVRTTAATGAVYGRPDIVWTEPQLELTGVAKYLVANDRVQLDNLQVRGKTLQLNSTATLDRATTEAQLQANGLLEYDANELAKLIASYAGRGMQLQGDQKVRFQLAGPLFDPVDQPPMHWSHRWNASAEAGWASAGAYGLPLGGGRLLGTLRAGQLQFEPLDVAVGQGRLTAQPLVSLMPGAEQFSLPKGPLVTNVEISTEVSETMLKYVAPILAGATRADGQFSVELDQTLVPFSDPQQSRVQGRLAVHRLNVSPGPMINQLATLIEQLEALTKRKQFIQAATAPSTKSILQVAERQIDFQVIDGRVYHRNLEFLIDNVPVRSYGSVGFDQTLALVIEVPIQDKWIDDEPALRSFAGQSLKLPIYGTFQKPKIDERAVADLSKQLLQGAATQVIGDELNRQFEKLFGR